MYQMLGAHLPIAKGFLSAAEYALLLKINHIQIFTASNRQMAIDYVIDDTRLLQFEEVKKQYKNLHWYSHAGYLMNLGSHDEEFQKKSIHMLQSELFRCDQLGIESVVIHPGSNKNREQGLERIIQSLSKVVDTYKGKTKILIENSAGQGSTLPQTIEDLQFLYTDLVSLGIGLCLDTCHLHVGMCDLNDSYQVERFLKEIDSSWGLKQVKMIHLNDSQKGARSHVDRHANIGKGTIKIDSLHSFLDNSYFKNIPKILETPYDNPRELKDDITALMK
jgi:deoxyribonuclease-4